MNRDQYHRVYLRSARWKAFRASIVAARGGMCERCGKSQYEAKWLYRQELNIHHLDYANIGHERPEDVQVLCFGCHRHETFYVNFIRDENGLSRKCSKCSFVYLIDTNPNPPIAIFQCPKCGTGGGVAFPEATERVWPSTVYLREGEEVDAEA